MAILLETLTDIIRGLAFAGLLFLTIPLVVAMVATIREKEGE